MLHTKNNNRKAFTMLELIFVIVIMGIIGKFGVEFLAQAYNNFIFSSTNNRLQANSATAVEFISTRLQNRIKASTIARETNATIVPQFTRLSDYFNQTAPIIEWVGADIDGFRGNSNGGVGVDNLPNWSGIIDLNSTISNQTQLFSPATDTGRINTLIQILSDTNSSISDAAIYFVDPDSLDSNWGWDANVTRFTTQVGVPGSENAIHPINSTFDLRTFLPVTSNSATGNTFSGVTAFEYYQLAWTAYAVGISNWDTTTNTGTLTLWYDYQPWKGDTYLQKLDGTPTKSSIIMENVSSFRFIAIESLIKIQVCVKSDLVEEYSVCKEKTVF
ncbi:MAG: prepilin-type N-terminal cleavage/methylation domain-containing protein [Sulfurimonas sp.]|nr:prepilin-type N-terminal cleavage/methylation domain-containing protein [Sulfurimonas sp.]